ncbi:MAG: alpha/beta hydrolase [Chloroflexota bacterium]|nr:alpha/beta hydrolase [Chloroflexota bacterium]
MMNTAPRTGYAPVNGLNLYYEIHGTGAPLVLLHGGFGATGMFGGLLPALAAHRQVIAVDLQGHGRTADIDRPLRIEHMADDIAALIAHLGLGMASVMGYSLGGAVALQTAIRHPDAVDRLVVVSTPHKRSAWYPENLAGMDQLGAAAAESMKQTPMYELYARIAPRPDDWTNLWAKMGDLLRRDYDWSAGVAALAIPTMLVFGDADSVSPAHAAAFFGLLGGGQRDGGWDRSAVTPHRLAILPGTTHYDILAPPALASTVTPFLDAPPPAAPVGGIRPAARRRAR